MADSPDRCPRFWFNWVYGTCLAFGASERTAALVATEFVRGAFT